VTVDLEGNPLPAAVPISTYRYETKKGKVYEGADALVAKYNEEVLAGEFMKLDNDGMWPSAINVSRKNYANLEANGKMKIVGNTLKDKTMPEYIKDFIDKGIRLMLEDKASEFVEYYYEYLTKIYMKQIPLRKIANKARVKMSKEEYMNRGTDKNGRAKGKQAHMELAIQDGLNIQNGDTIFYVNNGVRKSHTYTTLDKASGRLRAYALTKDELDMNPDKLGDYNVAKYIDSFNQRVSAILTPFKPVVRDTIIKKDPLEREYYTDGDMAMHAYQNPEPKDDINKFFIMEDSEVHFWNRTGLDPYRFLEEFTTPLPYYGHTYQKKLALAQRRLGPSGVSVRAWYDRYGNGDVVVTFQDEWMAVNPANAEEVALIPERYTKYVAGETELPYPLDEAHYQDFKAHTEVFGEKTRVEFQRRYHLNEVKDGRLVHIMEV
jgi:hypothetical protein